MVTAVIYPAPSSYLDQHRRSLHEAICDRLLARTEVTLSVLQDCRQVISDEVDTLLQSHCLLDTQTLQPLIETLDEAVRPEVAHLRNLLDRIDHLVTDLKVLS